MSLRSRSLLWSSLLALMLAIAPAAHSEALRTADKVVVYKGERRMVLLRNGASIAVYRIALGLDPIGHKEREGDFRTPEGRYLLTRRNTTSDYFLSIQVDYPSKEDIARARRKGVPPGGAIMIHGLPNVPRHPPEYYKKRDWTDGCIAISNSDMVEFWMLTQTNTPIDILP